MPNKRKPKPPPKKPPPKSRIIPFLKGKPRGRGRPKGSPKVPGSGRKKGTGNHINSEVKDFLHNVLAKKEYQDALEGRMIGGKAGVIELLAWHHEIGKPKETHVHEGEALASLLARAASRR